MSLLSVRTLKSTCPLLLLLAFLSDIHCAHLKSSLLDTEVLLLNLTKYLNSLDAEAILYHRLLNSFTDHIFFYYCNCLSLNNCIAYLEFLNHLCLQEVSFPSTLVITNVKMAESGLSFFLFFFLIFILFLIYFSLFLFLELWG